MIIQICDLCRENTTDVTNIKCYTVDLKKEKYIGRNEI